MTELIYGSLTGAFVFLAIFAYHYYNSRKRYLLIWTLAWFFSFLAHIFYLSYLLVEPILLSEVLIFQAAYLTAAILFLYGLYLFLQEDFPAVWLYASALFLGAGFLISYFSGDQLYLNLLSLSITGIIFVGLGFKMQQRAEFKLMKGSSIAVIIFGLFNIFYLYLVGLDWFFPMGQMVFNALGLILALTLKGLHYKKIERQLEKTRNHLQKKQKELEINEERYRTIFNAAPLGMIIQDEEGNIVEANYSMTELTGFDREELEGSNVLDKMVPPEHREIARGNIERLLQGEDLQEEFKSSTKSGATVYRQLTETRLNLPRGEKGILSMYLDITERRKKERIIANLHEVALDLKNLEEKELVLERTVKTAEEILELDFCSLYMVENERLVPEVYSEGLAGKIKERAIYVDSMAAKAHREGRSLLSEDLYSSSSADNLEYTFASALSVPVGDYGVFQALSQDKSAFTEEDLELAELLISHTTAALDRIYSEEELKDKNNLLNSILESIQDGISVLNPDLTIRYTNSTMEEWYAEKAPLSGKKCFQAYHEIDNPCDSCPSLRSLETGSVEKEILSGLSDSEVDYIEIYSYPIFAEDGEEITGIVEFVRDISERKKQKRELEMTKFSIDRADLIIMRARPDSTIEYVNETAIQKLGYSQEELLGSQGEMIISSSEYIARKEFWQKIKEAGSITYEREFIAQNGRTFPVEITSQYYEYQGEEYEFVFARDISERKKQEEEIQYLLYRDQLTELYNRRFMKEEMERLDTERQLPLSIIMVDVNGLKIVNDSLGHDKGDELLVKAAELLQEAVRSEDILARYGGDEFVIFLPKTGQEEAQKIVDRIKEKCQQTKSAELPVSIGAGTAVKESPEEELEDILQQADDRMYEDKLGNSRSRKHEVVEGLLKTLAANSSETIDHAHRMEELAQKLGRRLGLSTSQLNRLSLLATLHDIGKAAISEEILTKPGQLTEEEWETIRDHSRRGYRIASASEEFALVAEDILAHHEWWNGEGYPRGLAGEDIPLLARIISIVDAYDVMTHDRPYSEAVTTEEALQELQDCAGSQFDPDLVEEFVVMMEK